MLTLERQTGETIRIGTSITVEVVDVDRRYKTAELRITVADGTPVVELRKGSLWKIGDVMVLLARVRSGGQAEICVYAPRHVKILRGELVPVGGDRGAGSGPASAGLPRGSGTEQTGECPRRMSGGGGR